MQPSIVAALLQNKGARRLPGTFMQTASSYNNVSPSRQCFTTAGFRRCGKPHRYTIST